MSSRREIWFGLLGLDITTESTLRPRFWDASQTQIDSVAEYRVIEQDVVRTRAEMNYFRTPRVRHWMKIALLRYCGYYQLCYMQGLNEILAPLMAMTELLSKGYIARNENGEEEEDGVDDDHSLLPIIDESLQSSIESIDTENIDESNLGSLNISFLLFERIVDKLAPVVFATEGVQALQAQLASFHLLLYYFDADLHGFLSREGMTTDVYAQSWFITLFARRLPLHLALHLWDLLLAVDKPQIIIFLGVALLLHNKQKLISLPSEQVPETLVRINFLSEEEIDMVFQRALQLEAIIAPSAVQEIRRVGFDASLPENEREPVLYELMYRPCLTVSAADIAVSICSGARRFLVIECTPDSKSFPYTIEGSVSISAPIIGEICRVATSQLSSSGPVHCSAAAILTMSFLRSCREDDVHFVICGSDDIMRRSQSPSMISITESGNGTMSVGNSVSIAVKSNSSPNSINSKKRQEAKRENLISHNRLATALLVLGFSHVCVLKGAQMSSTTIANSLPFPSQLAALTPALCSKTDGHSALIYNLLKCGATISLTNDSSRSVTPISVLILVPQDAAIASKVALFVSQIATSNSSAIATHDALHEGNDLQGIPSVSENDLKGDMSGTGANNSKNIFGFDFSDTGPLSKFAAGTSILFRSISGSFVAPKLPGPIPKQKKQEDKSKKLNDDELM